MLDYSFILNTYEIPPKNVLPISILEQLGCERISLYKIMEEAINLNLMPNTQMWNVFIESEIRIRELKTYTTLLNETKYVELSRATEDDNIAHWLLSLCYCRTHQLRNCFMKWELQWFTLLYNRLARTDLNEFYVKNGFIYESVSSSEKRLLKRNLLECRNLNDDEFESLPYYKTSFTEITQLLASRKVFILKGIAYIPESDIIYCIRNKLWHSFSSQLDWTNKMLTIVVTEERLQQLLQNLPIFIITDTRPNPLDVSLENIDVIANNYYPLCMKTIHTALREDHHLKFDSKMQYGIFLKWIGLSYDDAMEFWKNEFTKKMSDDFFNRKYSYLFKHQYGMVGSKIQYEPHTCRKILRYSPLPGQYHGCPFKHWGTETLLQKLQEEGFLMDDVNSIEKLVDKMNYQEACTKYFCVKHRVIRDDIIHSPNQYAGDCFRIDKDLDNLMGSFCDDLSSQVM